MGGWCGRRAALSRHLLQLLVGVVDAELLEAVGVSERLEAVDVENADEPRLHRPVLGRRAARRDAREVELRDRRATRIAREAPRDARARVSDRLAALVDEPVEEAEEELREEREGEVREAGGERRACGVIAPAS